MQYTHTNIFTQELSMGRVMAAVIERAIARKARVNHRDKNLRDENMF